ncbi:MAG: UDP-glucose--hexose-1-phosphate uridylyltransferase [Firmicutes bacterium]|nr:UDP-glucose--hexose-1-phosphate uridylyltransferase [Bacillota bacterium]
MSVEKELILLIQYAKNKHLIENQDLKQVKSYLCDIFHINDLPFIIQTKIQPDFSTVMEPLLDDAYSNQLFKPNTLDERDAFEAKIMDAVMPSPNKVKFEFKRKFDILPNLATHYLFQLSNDANYIKTIRLKENISWSYLGQYGNLQLTINLAKPEKDPKEIARALKKPVHVDLNKPLCVLCKENEQNYDNARMNLRIVPIILGNELWHFQYSPYQYYNEHAIILHDIHRPMKITNLTFEYLLDFIDMFPEYFIGSNADLPIVGGSILNHDHFQAGRHHFPIESAKTIKTYQVNQLLVLEHILWPLSTIRLTSKSRDEISFLASLILDKWKNYSNQALEIFPLTNDIPHQTITPILRKLNDRYQMDLILRNNRTSEAYPDGIFHPHPDVQHIKKENIGLIEAMGLAILPGRLEKELEAIQQYLQGISPMTKELVKHKKWMNELSKYKVIDNKFLLNEVSKKFERVLEDSGAFKLNEQGNEAMHNFIDEIINASKVC